MKNKFFLATVALFVLLAISGNELHSQSGVLPIPPAGDPFWNRSPAEIQQWIYYQLRGYSVETRTTATVSSTSNSNANHNNNANNNNSDPEVNCNQGYQDPYDGGQPQPDDLPSAEGGPDVYEPVDPNEITGTSGYDAPATDSLFQWVAATQSLPYTIYFENDPEIATAAAQKVEIRHQFHPLANIATFGIGSFGFGEHVFAVEGNPSSYQQRLDLTESMGIFVDVVAGIDVVTGEAFWIFQSIDPETGLAPQGVEQGFLPINDENHSGEGFVTFTIKPKSLTCVTGDLLTASASIVFDINEAISTNVWHNTVDALPPTTQLTGNELDANTLQLQFTGADNEGGCGIKQYKLYVSDNFAAYKMIGTYPLGSTAEFPTEYNHCYRFYCLGEDNVGNVEELKTEPDFEYGNYNLTVTVSASPEESGSVSGEGMYVYDSQVTVTAIAAPGYEFYRWTLNGVPVSEDPTYVFSITEDMNLVAQFIETNFNSQEVALARGWNWWSSYIDLSDNGLTALEEALGDNGIMVKSQNDGYVIYDDGDWYGVLTLNNQSMYRIRTSAEVSSVMTGFRTDVSQLDIEMSAGWSWIGYPIPVAQTLEDALMNLDANKGDLLKSKRVFAVYDGESKWFGPLHVMEPGQGYVYKSSQPHSFQYHNGRGVAVEPEGDHFWKSDVYAYPDNMSIIAVVAVDGIEQRTEQLELGAFSNGEMVGSTRLLHNAKRDRWYAMIPVSGNGGEEVTFRLYDAENGYEYGTDAEESFVFTSDDVIGNLDNPVVLNFRMLTETAENAETMLRIYPNPVAKGGEVRLSLPEDAGKVRVEIYNVLDVSVCKTEITGNTVTIGSFVSSGAYLMKVFTESGKVYYGRLIVK